jgi:hypothetical protein
MLQPFTNEAPVVGDDRGVVFTGSFKHTGQMVWGDTAFIISRRCVSLALPSGLESLNSNESFDRVSALL